MSPQPARRADLVLSGDVDLAACRPLADAVDQLAAAAPDTTVVDLAAVTFAGATTLVNFLASLRAAVPA
jgi:anti-anti-sigma regulatory factor